jgi:Ca-activated chloride channel family protein
MDAVDVQPSRIERAKQKVRDLLALRPGARTGLLAYAGSAHMVLPLTDDAAILETYLESLATSIMPTRGKDPTEALARAEQMFARDSAAGTILFITDGIGERYAGAFKEHAKSSRHAVLVLAIGTAEGGAIRGPGGELRTGPDGAPLVARLDEKGLKAVSEEAGVPVRRATIDAADVRTIQRQIRAHQQRVNDEEGTQRWQDFGYWLVFPAALMTLAWFRRGWSIRWVAVLLVSICFVLPGCSRDEDPRFADLWLTRDQQGRSHFERGDYLEAAKRFEDPLWKGIALCRAGEYDSAAAEFARVQTAEGFFNLGNAYARSGRHAAAAGAYEQALDRQGDYPDARFNLALVRSLVPAQKENTGDEPGGEPSLDPDEVKFDEKGKKGKAGEVDLQQLSEEQIAELWLRKIQTTPAQFLRNKFAYQAQAAESQPR